MRDRAVTSSYQLFLGCHYGTCAAASSSLLAKGLQEDSRGNQRCLFVRVNLSAAASALFTNLVQLRYSFRSMLRCDPPHSRGDRQGSEDLSQESTFRNLLGGAVVGASPVQQVMGKVVVSEGVVLLDSLNNSILQVLGTACPHKIDSCLKTKYQSQCQKWLAGILVR